MASVVNTNVMSINAQRNLMSTQADMATTIQRLSSGLRINSAKDDAAGLAIAEGMTSQVRGLEVAKRNAADGISIAQTAEGALGEITNNVQRIRELAVQAASDTLTTADRTNMAKEITQLDAENARIIGNTEFNGTALLTGALNLNIQVGANKGETIALKTDDVSAINSGTAKIDISDAAKAATSLDDLDTDLATLNGARATLGAIQNRFDSVISNISNYSENLQAARSRIQDTDFAQETANMTRNQILSQAGTAMVSQANSIPQGVLSLLG